MVVRLSLVRGPFLVATLGLLTACGEDTASAPPPVAAVAPAPPAPSAPPSAAPVAPTWTGKGVNVAAMDRSVSPGADFFAYANGAWLRATEIPADRSGTGAFVILDELSQRRTRAILDDASAATTSATGDAKKAGDYYATFMDQAAIEAKGTKPVAAALERIAKIGDKRALATALGASIRADVNPLNHSRFQTNHFLGLWAEQNLNNPSHIVPYLLQGGLGMPDRSYYLDEKPRMADLRTKYQAHVAAMMTLAGLKNAEARAARVFALERKIAAIQAPPSTPGTRRRGTTRGARRTSRRAPPGSTGPHSSRGRGSRSRRASSRGSRGQSPGSPRS